MAKYLTAFEGMVASKAKPTMMSAAMVERMMPRDLSLSEVIAHTMQTIVPNTYGGTVSSCERTEEKPIDWSNVGMNKPIEFMQSSEQHSPRAMSCVDTCTRASRKVRLSAFSFLSLITSSKMRNFATSFSLSSKKLSVTGSSGNLKKATTPRNMVRRPSIKKIQRQLCSI